MPLTSVNVSRNGLGTPPHLGLLEVLANLREASAESLCSDHCPCRSQLAALHGRLLAGDAAAVGPLVELLWPHLSPRLAAAFPRVDEALRWDGFTLAIEAYMRCPERYDPAKYPSLDHFFFMVARRRTCDLLRAQKRHDQRTEKISKKSSRREAFARSATTTHIEEDILESQELLKKVARALRDPEDGEVFSLMADGERGITRFAEVLGVGHLTPQEQRQKVKHAKQRVRRRAKTIAKKLGINPLPINMNRFSYLTIGNNRGDYCWCRQVCARDRPGSTGGSNA